LQFVVVTVGATITGEKRSVRFGIYRS